MRILVIHQYFLGASDAARIEAWLGAGIRVMDLADIDGADRGADGYEGIAW